MAAAVEAFARVPEGRAPEANHRKRANRRAQRLAAIKVPDIVEHRRPGTGGRQQIRTFAKAHELGKVRFHTETRLKLRIIPSQGGFARCFQFRLLETGEELAGKVVAKESLTKERARLKVRCLHCLMIQWVC
jgi:hypothetical protein